MLLMYKTLSAIQSLSNPFAEGFRGAIGLVRWIALTSPCRYTSTAAKIELLASYGICFILPTDSQYSLYDN